MTSCKSLNPENPGSDLQISDFTFSRQFSKDSGRIFFDHFQPGALAGWGAIIITLCFPFFFSANS
jgi:hypothetical protein